MSSCTFCIPYVWLHTSSTMGVKNETLVVTVLVTTISKKMDLLLHIENVRTSSVHLGWDKQQKCKSRREGFCLQHSLVVTIIVTTSENRQENSLKCYELPDFVS